MRVSYVFFACSPLAPSSFTRKEDRRGYYRDCDIRAIPRVAIYVTRSRYIVASFVLLRGADEVVKEGHGRARGKNCRRGGQEVRRGRRSYDDEDAYPVNTLVLEWGLLHRSAEFIDDWIEVEVDFTARGGKVDERKRASEAGKTDIGCTRRRKSKLATLLDSLPETHSLARTHTLVVNVQ